MGIYNFWQNLSTDDFSDGLTKGVIPMKTGVHETYECWEALDSGSRRKAWGDRFRRIDRASGFSQNL